MNTLLLSIHPEFVDKIISGKKKFEYRKSVPRQEISKLLIYATNPIKSIVATADIKNILVGTLEDVWKQTNKLSGITEEFYNEYYSKRQIAVAIEMSNIIKFTPYSSLSFYNIKRAPQGYVYLEL